MMNLAKFAWTCAFAAALLLMSGCNSDRISTYPVEGTIKFPDGTHPMFGTIEFFNDQHKLNAKGEITREGTFTVSTFSENDGAVAGSHKIVITQVVGNPLFANVGSEITHDHGELVSPKYLDYRTSGLTCEIEPGDNPVELIVEKAN